MSYHLDASPIPVSLRYLPSIVFLATSPPYLRFSLSLFFSFHSSPFEQRSFFSTLLSFASFSLPLPFSISFFSLRIKQVLQRYSLFELLFVTICVLTDANLGFAFRVFSFVLLLAAQYVLEIEIFPCTMFSLASSSVNSENRRKQILA